LRDEQKTMEERERKLAEWERSLNARQMEMNVVTQYVWQLQTDLDRSVVRVSEEEVTNLKRLAKVYADMTPEDAAKVMANLEDVVVVKIMLFMKENETAAILETLAKSPDQAKRAAEISEHVLLSISHNTSAK
jgi:flagellar motility protein MotE (MotC chaperone)